MPVYRVNMTGFYEGSLRAVGDEIVTETLMKPLPSWMSRVEGSDPTPQQKAAATRKANAEKKVNEAKAKEDKIDTDAVTFLDPVAASKVETL